jgi:hypothetical protein
MRFPDFKPVRLVFLCLVFFSGLVSGFIAYEPPNFSELEKSIKKVETNLYGRYRVESGNSKGTFFILPVFENGRLSEKIFAEKIIWQKDKRVFLINPVVLKYNTEDGSVIGEIKGSYGSIYIDKQRRKIGDINMWGEVRVLNFSNNQSGRRKKNQ